MIHVLGRNRGETLLESILTSVKKLLGITEDYEHFDADLIIGINSVFMILNQLGVGPDPGYRITNKEDKWSDYILDKDHLDLVKSYMYMKVKLMFDPPTSSAAIEAMNRQISEFEWRLSVAADKVEK